MSVNSLTVTILGCGTMGTAVLSAILSNEDASCVPKKIITLTGSAKSKQALEEKFGSSITTSSDATKAVEEADVVIVGLKPYACASVLGPLKDQLQGKLLISLVAGWTIAQLSEYSEKVARVMTNTPAKFGFGMAAVALSSHVSEDEGKIVDTLVARVGKIITVPESKMDLATSLIGSGPAFVLLMMEAMIDSGIKLGFTYEESRKSVLQVIEGTAKMVEATSLHPAVLKAQVCTPGGTTINGLAKMEEKGLRTAIIQGVQEAKDVATALGKK